MTTFFKIRHLLILLLAACRYSAFAGFSIVNGLSHEIVVEPGGIYQISVLVNPSSECSPLIVKTQEVMFDSLGNATFASFHPKQSHLRSNASWIDYNRQPIVVNGTKQTAIVINIKVPDVLPDSGSFWSAVTLEEQSSDLLETVKGLSVKTVLRYAVVIMTHTRGNRKGLFSFKPVEINMEREADQEKVNLSFCMLNKSIWIIRPDITLDYIAEDGSSGRIKAQSKRRAFPDFYSHYNFDITALKPVQYKAWIVVDDGSDELSGVEVSLDLRNR